MSYDVIDNIDSMWKQISL